ncbi:MAG: sulfotransferase [Terriglobia bacterium]
MKTAPIDDDSRFAPGPLFVVGIWRSGTSLLYALLNQHPCIALMYEADFLTLQTVILWPGNAARWAARFEDWNSSLSRHGIDPASIPSGISSLARASETVYKIYAGQKRASVWGEKSPNYYDSLRRVSGYFPNARFIVIWRDPASICRSILRAAPRNPWFAKRGITHRALLGCEKLKVECDRLRRGRAHLREISYHDLTSDPQRVMEGICQFLELPFDRRMACLEDADRSAIYEGEHHTQVKGSGIVPPQKASEVLPQELNAKLERYVSHWRRKYGGRWPALAGFPVSSGAAAGWVERLWDELLYKLYRSFDWAMRLFYCWAPLSLLAAYKARKRRHDAAAIETRKTVTSDK